MYGENSPPQSEWDDDKVTTLGDSPLGAFDHDHGDPPLIDDVAGLEDLYVASTGPSSPDGVAPAHPGSDGFNPVQTGPVEEMDGRLPPPLDFAVDLKFSVEAPTRQRPAWSFDEGMAEHDVIEPAPMEPVFEPALSSVPTRAVRSPGEARRPATVVETISDMADRHWFRTSIVTAAIAALGLGLVVSSLLSGPEAPTGPPNVVADDVTDVDSDDVTDPRSPTTGASTSSAQLGTVGAGVDGSGDTTTEPVETTATTGRKPPSTIATTTSADPTSTTSTTDGSTSLSTTSSVSSSTSSTADTTSTSSTTGTTTPDSSTTTSATTTTTSGPATSDPGETTPSSEPGGTTTTTGTG